MAEQNEFSFSLCTSKAPDEAMVGKLIEVFRKNDFLFKIPSSRVWGEMEKNDISIVKRTIKSGLDFSKDDVILYVSVMSNGFHFWSGVRELRDPHDRISVERRWTFIIKFFYDLVKKLEGSVSGLFGGSQFENEQFSTEYNHSIPNSDVSFLDKSWILFIPKSKVTPSLVKRINEIHFWVNNQISGSYFLVKGQVPDSVRGLYSL